MDFKSLCTCCSVKNTQGDVHYSKLKLYTLNCELRNKLSSDLSSCDNDALDEGVQGGVSGFKDGHAEEEDGVDARKLLPEHQQQTKKQRDNELIS